LMNRARRAGNVEATEFASTLDDIKTELFGWARRGRAPIER
jgi:hypothetical protein